VILSFVLHEVAALLKKRLMRHASEASIMCDGGLEFRDSGDESDDSGLEYLINGDQRAQ